jgi:hypothetical protein
MPEADVPKAVAYDPRDAALAPADRVDLDAAGVEAGAVFLARTRQQRRVWAVRDGRVHFFVRPPGGATFWSPGHPPHLAPTIALFLAEVTGRLTPSAGRKGAELSGRSGFGPDRPIPPHKNAYR